MLCQVQWSVSHRVPILVILQRFLHLISGLKPNILQFQNVENLASKKERLLKKIKFIIPKKTEL